MGEFGRTSNNDKLQMSIEELHGYNKQHIDPIQEQSSF